MFPKGSSVQAYYCNENGDREEGCNNFFSLTLSRALMPGSKIGLKQAKPKPDGSGEYRYMRLSTRLHKGDEFEYEFNGVKLRVVVQKMRQRVDEPIVVPLPINFSHNHQLVLIGIDESFDRYHTVAKDINQKLLTLGECVKDYNESKQTLLYQNCMLMMPSYKNFVGAHLNDKIGYFTKLHVGGEKMDAKQHRAFVAKFGLRMTSMLIHKTKILDYNAPLVFVPPPNELSASFLHRSQPSQEIRDGIDSAMEAFRDCMKKFPVNAVQLALALFPRTCPTGRASQLHPGPNATEEENMRVLPRIFKFAFVLEASMDDWKCTNSQIGIVGVLLHLKTFCRSGASKELILIVQALQPSTSRCVVRL